MVMDSKGRRHQPKGMPGAGRFAAKPGARDDSDLAYNPDGTEGTPDRIHNGVKGVMDADAGQMREFMERMRDRPVVAMGDREYGEAATVEDGRVRLYSGLYPDTPLLEFEPENGIDPRKAAEDALTDDRSVLERFAVDCGSRRVFEVLPQAERVDDTTVRVPEADGGHVDVEFDADVALVTGYDRDGNRRMDDWISPDDDGHLDGYMDRVAAMVGGRRIR